MDVQNVVLVIVGVLLSLCLLAAVLGFVGELLEQLGGFLHRER